MTEALIPASETIISQIKEPSHEEIPGLPKKYWKSTLVEKRRMGKLLETEWVSRSLKVEDYIKRVLQSEKRIIRKVELDDNDRDSEGPDARIILVKGFPITELFGEFKSSPETIEAYKHDIRDSLPKNERDPQHVTKHLVKCRIILINGGVGRSTKVRDISGGIRAVA